MEIIKTPESFDFFFYGKSKTYKIPTSDSLGISGYDYIILRTAQQIYYASCQLKQNQDGNFYWTDNTNVYIYSLKNTNGSYSWEYQYSYPISKNEVDPYLNISTATEIQWANYNIYNDSSNIVIPYTEPIDLNWMNIIEWNGATEEGSYEVIDNKVYQKIDDYTDIKDFLIQFGNEYPTNTGFVKEDFTEGWKIYDDREELHELIAYGNIPRYEAVTLEDDAAVGEYTEGFVEGGIFFLAQTPIIPIIFCYYYDSYLRPRQHIKERITEIANAIREKTYYQGQLYLEDMPDKIRNIISYRTVTGTEFVKNNNIVTETSTLEDGTGFQSTIEFDLSTGLAKKVIDEENEMEIEIVRDSMNNAEKVILNGREFLVSWSGFV